MSKLHTQYSNPKTALCGRFVEGLKENAVSEGTFDSAAAADHLTSIRNTAGEKMPEAFEAILDDVGTENEAYVTRKLLDGVSAFEANHGFEPSADVIEWALHQGFGTTDQARKRYSLDDASSAHHDEMSLQPNRAVIAIVSAFAEAIPVAHYLPADIGSNESKLAIINHLAGSAHGGYAVDAVMDGISSGYKYVSTTRVHKATWNSTDSKWEGKVTAIQTNDETCDQAAPNLKTLRGRAIVYVNGFPVGKESDPYGSSANSALSGSIVIGSTAHVIGGFITVDTGVFEVTATPALPGSAVVHVEAVIDLERATALTPIINTAARTFKLFASPWRATAHQTIDSRTQFSNELGIDSASEALLAIRAQFANERHYDVLNKALRVGANNSDTFNFDWAGQKSDKTRSDIWQDFSAVLGRVSQKMAEETFDHGITHLYVSKNIMAQLLGMPSNLFEPSGITDRAGIYRIGRLFGRYEVYYAPRVATDVSSTASKIVCIGRSSQVARNPFVLGDAVAPMVAPLAFGQDMRYGAGFYARNYTAVNPHEPSARGCAVIDVTNL